MAGNVDNAAIIEIKASYGPIGSRLRRLLRDRHCRSRIIQLNDAIPLRRSHLVGEDRRAGVARDGGLEAFAKPFAVEDVVAQDQTDPTAIDEFGTDNEGLCDALRSWLFGKGESQTDGAAVAQQALEQRQVLGCRDDQHVPYPGQHQHR